jgi:hypothetical protein
MPGWTPDFIWYPLQTEMKENAIREIAEHGGGITSRYVTKPSVAARVNR